MVFQMRRGVRRVMDRDAWIKLGEGLPLRPCTLADLSDSGAKLKFEDQENGEIPQAFDLLLTRHGHPSYPCRVVWRKENVIGVQFVD